MGIERNTYMEEHTQYEFDRLINLDIVKALTEYGLGLYEHNRKHTVLYGKTENVELFAEEYLGIKELDPDRTYVY